MDVMYHLQGKQEFLSCFENREKRYFHWTRLLTECAINIILDIYSAVIKHVPSSGPLHVLFLLDCPLRYLQGSYPLFIQVQAQGHLLREAFLMTPSRRALQLPILLHVTLFFTYPALYQLPCTIWHLKKYTCVYAHICLSNMCAFISCLSPPWLAYMLWKNRNVSHYIFSI